MEACFSTETVDLNNQQPNRNKRESKYYWDELYRLIAAAGFTSIEVPYEPKWDFGGRSGIPRTLRSIMVKYGTMQHYMAEIKEAGIEDISSVHLDPSLFCQGSLQMYLGAFRHYGEEAMQFAKEAGAKKVILTATPSIYAVKRMLKGASQGEEEFLGQIAQTIDNLAIIAKEEGLKLCLKNEYWGLLRGEEILRFLKQCREEIYLDIDTAHLQIADVDIAKFITANKVKIGAVHFTDTGFTDRQDAYLQPLPEYPAKEAAKVFCDIGEGRVDFPVILKALENAGYDGTIIYNCKDSYDVCRSLLRTRYFINYQNKWEGNYVKH